MEGAGGRELRVLELLGGRYGEGGIIRGEAIADRVEVDSGTRCSEMRAAGSASQTRIEQEGGGTRWAAYKRLGQCEQAKLKQTLDQSGTVVGQVLENNIPAPVPEESE